MLVIRQMVSLSVRNMAKTDAEEGHWQLLIMNVGFHT